MASFGKVLNLLDDRYLELQDVTGNVEPLPTLVPYDEYAENIIVYRMDTNHEIFLGLIQDFTLRRAHETGEELWSWLVQWKVEDTPPVEQLSSPKKVRTDAQHVHTAFKAPPTPRQAPALTIFERRTLDGALMLEEDMLRILIDIVQVTSSLVPNFIEFLYRWVDYYEGDGKALKAALRWEIPSLWDFEYHPLVLPRDRKNEDTGLERETTSDGQTLDRTRSTSETKVDEARQSSPTKKMHARPKPDLAAIELQTFYTEESERLQYREVKFGIQPPKLEQHLPPLINIPRDPRKRTKYYAACFKSRQRALYLLLEAGVTMRQINNYQKLQSAHPKETPETNDGNGLRNYQKDAKYAQAQFQLKEKQIKQREIAISDKLAIEAQLAATHAMPDGAAGLPLIPPTPSHVRKPDMAAAMMQRIKESRAKRDEKIKVVPKPLVGRLKSKVFEAAQKGSEFRSNTDVADTDIHATVVPVPAPRTSRPLLPLPLPLPPQPAIMATTSITAANNFSFSTSQAPTVGTSVVMPMAGRFIQPTPPELTTYIQNLNPEQAQRLLPLLDSQTRQALTNSIRGGTHTQSTAPGGLTSSPANSMSLPGSSQSGYSVDSSSSSKSLGVPCSGPSLLSSPSGSQEQGIAVNAGESSIALPVQPSVSAPLTLPPHPQRLLSSSSGALGHLQEAQHADSSSSQGSFQSSSSSLPKPMPESAEAGQEPISPPASANMRAENIPSFPVHAFPPPAPRPTPGFDPGYFMYLRRQQEALRSGSATGDPRQAVSTHTQSLAQSQSQSQSQSCTQHQQTLPTTSSAMDVPARTEQVQATQVSPRSPNEASNPSSTPQLHVPSPHPPRPPIRPGLSRAAPAPLPIPHASPLTRLAPHLLPPARGFPIQIYFPRILRAGRTRTAADALMLGYAEAGTDGGTDGKWVLSKAILLSMGVWENTLRKVRSGRWDVLDAFAFPCPHYSDSESDSSSRTRSQVQEHGRKTGHAALYAKLALTYSFMCADDPGLRETQLTKRWRVSRGQMTRGARGAVWEGWGVGVDRGVEVHRGERRGGVVREREQEKVDEDGDAGRRRGEVDELLEEEEE